MPDHEVHAPGVETRLKKQRRGFYHDPSPGFAAVGESHAAAKARAGEKKLACVLDGARSALAKFGLLQRKDGDPVEAMSDLFRYEDFGLPVRGDPTKGRPPRPLRALRDRSFGPAAPPGSAGSAMEFSSAVHPDTAMAYHGV